MPALEPQIKVLAAPIKLLRVGSGGAGASGRKHARLLREAHALARLAHPNVVAVYDVGTFRDRVFIALELVEGCTLHEWLRQRERPWREVLEVCLTAGRGLAAAHAAGLIHRDFKPDNVLIGKEGRLSRGLGRDPSQRFQSMNERDWARQAAAAIERLGGSARLQASLADEQVALLLAEGKHSEAIEQGRKALALREQLQGAEHLSTAASLRHLADALRARGSAGEAEALEKRAIAVEHTLLGR